MTLRRYRLLPSMGVAAVCAAGLVLGLAGCTSKTRQVPANTIHVPQPMKVKGLDPAFADDVYVQDEVGRAYEGLLQYHYLKRPYVLVPNLAESLPEVSKDGKVLTFHLKKGVLFQDDRCFKATGGKGRELIAEDVVYSFLRLADPKVHSTGWWVLEGKIAGLNEWRAAAETAPQADYAKPVEGLKALDRYTVQITLTQRRESFLYSFAMPFLSIVPREAVEHYGKEFLNHPVGTGPFRLAEFSGNSKLIWVKNPTFRREIYPSEGEPGDKEAGLLEDAGKPLPLADRLEVQVYEEAQPMWLSFMTGKLERTWIPKDSFQDAITPGKELSGDLQAKGIRLSKLPMIEVTHLTFNMADPLLGKNKLLRQALSLAYDQDKFIELFHNGRAIPAQGPIPPGVHGYDPTYKNPYRQYNVARARELLAKAGYPEGRGLPPLQMLATSESVTRQIVEYTTRLFEAIGVKLKVEFYSWPEFQAGIKNRRGQLWSYAWTGDYPDAENFLELFYSKNASPGPNDSNYSNPEYDRLFEELVMLPLGDRRLPLYRKMVAILTEDCPWIWGNHRIAYRLSQPWLKNFKWHDFDHTVLKYQRVERAK